ncbi:MAG: hypothetical protein RMN25_13905, partial [Anaerolineae bacterium]|nr:hypothetical protein [Thermoflexales bacterium]MDW8408865.1 hypothetical protein [Anaerolineae bacterium]
GLTPEVGLYLREQTSSLAASHVIESEGPNAMRWWYLTRAGMHGEEGETAFLTPFPAWSHFLAHAYILGNSRAQLRRWLDRPWGRGDLYSIQKIVATIHAQDDANVTPRAWLPIVLRGSSVSSPPTETPTPTLTPTSTSTPTPTPTPTSTPTPTPTPTTPPTAT